MHYAFINESGELTRSWDAGRVTITNGKKTFTLRASGLLDGKFSPSEVNNSALGYAVDGLAHGCNPANKKEREYAAHILNDVILARVPDSAEVIYGMPELDSAGHLTGEFVDVLKVNMSDVRSWAEKVIEWTPVGEAVNPFPTPPVTESAVAKPGKTAKKKITVMDWDDDDDDSADG